MARADYKALNAEVQVLSKQVSTKIINNLAVVALLVAAMTVSSSLAFLFVSPAKAYQQWCTYAIAHDYSYPQFHAYVQISAVIETNNDSCTGSRSVYYVMFSEGSYAVDRIDTTLDRAWTCGTLTFTTTKTVWGTSNSDAPDSPWGSRTSCGWQADLQTRYQQIGAFDIWLYTNL